MEWKKIEGFPDYEISNAGDVISARTGIRKPVKLYLSEHGYYVVKLAGAERYHTRHLHRLLAEAFVPGFQPGLVVNHKDGKKLNNTLQNLEWISQSQNNKHAFQHLEKTTAPKLEYDDAVAMRNDRRSGMTYRELMEKYKVGYGVVVGIILNKNYKEEGLFQRRKRVPL